MAGEQTREEVAARLEAIFSSALEGEELEQALISIPKRLEKFEGKWLALIHWSEVKYGKPEDDFGLTPVGQLRSEKELEAIRGTSAKEAKIAAFSRRNYQSGHNYPTNQQKENSWQKERGRCVYCKKRRFQVETSFWWRIFPNLEVVTACDACAEDDGLVEEEPSEPQRSSRSISQEVRDEVWNRDKGKCTECGSNENLEFDHIIPHAKGGANRYRNIQLLCQDCNRRKSDNIG